MFYTLPKVSSQSKSIQWEENANLKQYIKRLNTPDCRLIAHYLVTTIPSSENNACHNGCLSAHLAHISFGVANYRRPHDIRATHLKLKEQYGIDDLADLYQIGLSIVLQPREFLSNFDPDLSTYQSYWYPSFRSWVQTTFDRRLTDTIRAQKGMVNFNRTNLYLVAHATNAKVIKALKHQNYDPSTYPIYRALRSCLEKANNAGQFDTRNPQSAHYAEVLALYRQQQGVPSLGYEQIVSYIARLGIAIRNYDRPQLVSTDVFVGGEKDDRRSLIDTIDGSANPFNPSDGDNRQGAMADPLVRAIGMEDRQESDRANNHANNIVTELLQQLPSESDRTLLLFYGLNFTQDDVALQLDCHQVTAKHRRDRILATLAQQIHQNINPAAPKPALKSEQLNRLVTEVKDYCQEYYGNPLKSSVIDRLPQLPIESDRLLMLLHGLALNPEQVSIELDCHQTTVTSQHDRILTILAESICQQINANSACPPLSAQHYRIVNRAIAYCQYYYAELLEDTIQRFQNQELQARIDRVQSRWKLQFLKETEPDGNKIKVIGGAALVALTKIINKKS
jgi:RNA polymerase sigma factor (sigma-70 family)